MHLQCTRPYTYNVRIYTYTWGVHTCTVHVYTITVADQPASTIHRACLLSGKQALLCSIKNTITWNKATRNIVRGKERGRERERGREGERGGGKTRERHTSTYRQRYWQLNDRRTEFPKVYACTCTTLHAVQCYMHTLHAVQCYMHHTARCTVLHAPHCTLYSATCTTLHAVQCYMHHTARCTVLHAPHCTLYSATCTTLHTVQCYMHHTAHCTVLHAHTARTAWPYRVYCTEMKERTISSKD